MIRRRAQDALPDTRMVQVYVLGGFVLGLRFLADHREKAWDGEFDPEGLRGLAAEQAGQ
jgi:hypothetical protein